MRRVIPIRRRGQTRVEFRTLGGPSPRTPSNYRPRPPGGNRPGIHVGLIPIPNQWGGSNPLINIYTRPAYAPNTNHNNPPVTQHSAGTGVHWTIPTQFGFNTPQSLGMASLASWQQAFSNIQLPNFTQWAFQNTIFDPNSSGYHNYSVGPNQSNAGHQTGEQAYLQHAQNAGISDPAPYRSEANQGPRTPGQGLSASIHQLQYILWRNRNP